MNCNPQAASQENFYHAPLTAHKSQRHVIHRDDLRIVYGMKLSEIQPGQSCVVTGVQGVVQSSAPFGAAGRIPAISEKGSLRLRLLELGLLPGTRVSVTRRAPLGDPIELSMRGYSLTLRAPDATLITVSDTR